MGNGAEECGGGNEKGQGEKKRYIEQAAGKSHSSFSEKIY